MDRRGLTAMMAAVGFILVGVPAATAQPEHPEEESIVVSCFKGDSAEGIPLGNLTVTKPETGARDCNATYYDCEDKCVGCYYDQSLDKNICYDKNGRIINKEAKE